MQKSAAPPRFYRNMVKQKDGQNKISVSIYK